MVLYYHYKARTSRINILTVRDHREFFRLMKADEESGNQGYPALFERARNTPTPELAYYVQHSSRGIERSRLVLHCIQRRLAMPDGEVPPDGDILTLPRFAYLKDRKRESLLALQEEAQRDLKRYEEALRIAAAMLGERMQ